MLLLSTEIAAVWLVAADTTSSGFDLAVYGAAGTTIAILLWFIKTLWQDNRDLRRDLQAMATSSLEKVTVVATTASHQLAETGKSMEAATTMMHALAGKPSLSAEQIYETVALLRELKDQRRAR